MTLGLILATVAILAGIGGLLTTCRYCRYSMQWQRRHAPPSQLPRVTVVAPHRGPIIRGHVEALIAQVYPATWNVIFVTTREDASYPQLEACARDHSHVEVVLAEDVVRLAKEKGIHRGQKCHNLVTALSRVPPDTELIAVIDSDVCPSPDWLRTLVEPFGHAHDRLGATTLARFYVPGPGLAAHAQAAWILGSAPFMLEPWGYIWGGSFAVQREVLEKTDVLARWKGIKGSITCDDLGLSVALRLAGYRACHVPGYKAVRTPRAGETWSDVLGFTNRQVLHMWWTRRDLWLAAFVIHGVKSIALLCALGIAWFQPVALLALCAPAMDLAGFALEINTLRSLDHSDRSFLRSQRKAVLVGGSLAPLLWMINTIVATTRSHMRWGGVDYTYRTVEGYTANTSWRRDRSGQATGDGVSS